MIDFHSHLIPGIDDGASTLDETRAALRLMREQGVTTVLTTPHISAALTLRPDKLDAELQPIEDAWSLVIGTMAPEYPELRLLRGHEVMLDTPEPDLSDPRLRLAGGVYVLVEFPSLNIPLNAARTLQKIGKQGYRPIVAHPERYRNLKDFSKFADFRSAGGLLQVNCGSLVGAYGPQAQRAARTLIERGWADFLSSDYHARGTLHVSACRDALESAGGNLQSSYLFEGNPARMLRGELPEPVPPLVPQRSIWSHLFGRFSSPQ